MIYRILVILALLGAASAFPHMHQIEPTPLPKRLAHLPKHHEGWFVMDEHTFDMEILDILQPTSYLYRSYSNEAGQRVDLYIGYHDGGAGSGEIHSPRNCLPGSGWNLVDSADMRLPTATGEIDAVRAVYRKKDVSDVFYYWFQVGGRTLTDEYSLKLAELVNAAFHRRKDAAFVRINVTLKNDENAATAAGEQFVRDFAPLIASVLPR